ncbi:MAG: FAD-binding protein, partial [Deltaproteobacteria bacterium]|nr:FAD-binding protein [Deltaproteobacteria bacterium]
MLNNIVKNEIKRIFGEKNSSFSKEDLICYSYDATNSVYLPDAVVFPAGPEEISLLLKMANSESFPVIPRGAGTGFSGGSLPVEGGVVISMERMRRVLEIDAENLTALVEPGVVTWEFQQEVEALGLFYPPDPTSLKFSTIGGNIAECAGGPRAVKYGVTRDYVLGLEVVLPAGEIINTGVETAKGVVGYDLTRLLVGSEGTLGIITKARLKLLPLPQSKKTMLAAFSDLKDAARAVSEIIRSKILPSTLELIDSVCIKAVEDYAKISLVGADAVLLIEVDGNAAEVAENSSV